MAGMTKDDIISLPNPHLREQSKRITAIDDDAHQLIDHMTEAALDWEASRPHETRVFKSDHQKTSVK